MRLGKHTEEETTKADERAWHGSLDRNTDRKDPSLPENREQGLGQFSRGIRTISQIPETSKMSPMKRVWI